MTNLNEARVLIIEDEPNICKSMNRALDDSGLEKERIFPNIGEIDDFYKKFYENINHRDKFFNFIATYICENEINFLIIDLHLREEDSKSEYVDTMGFKLIEDLVSNSVNNKLNIKEKYLYFAIPKLIISNHPKLDELKKEHSYFVTGVFSKQKNIKTTKFKEFFEQNNIINNIAFNINYFKNIQALNQNNKLYKLMKSVDNKLDHVIIKLDNIVETIVSELDIEKCDISETELSDIVKIKFPFLFGEIDINALWKAVNEKYMKWYVSNQLKDK